MTEERKKHIIRRGGQLQRKYEEESVGEGRERYWHTIYFRRLCWSKVKLYGVITLEKIMKRKMWFRGKDE